MGDEPKCPKCLSTNIRGLGALEWSDSASASCRVCGTFFTVYRDGTVCYDPEDESTSMYPCSDCRWA